ncbi:hypothetical protein ABIE44_000654 [Marmoricola sp. OAE513]|uniref:hypothetical protein n=1 Tax=Marmoricola sp. OAE513 TaxID=2817894 RepID=UPI00339A22D2
MPNRLPSVTALSFTPYPISGRLSCMTTFAVPDSAVKIDAPCASSEVSRWSRSPTAMA